MHEATNPGPQSLKIKVKYSVGKSSLRNMFEEIFPLIKTHGEYTSDQYLRYYKHNPSLPIF